MPSHSVPPKSLGGLETIWKIISGNFGLQACLHFHTTLLQRTFDGDLLIVAALGAEAQSHRRHARWQTCAPPFHWLLLHGNGAVTAACTPARVLIGSLHIAARRGVALQPARREDHLPKAAQPVRRLFSGETRRIEHRFERGMIRLRSGV